MTNSTKKSKIFISIIGILLVINIGVVSFLLLNKKSSKHEKRPDRKTMISNFLKTELDFDSAQLLKYDSLSNRHKEIIKKMYDSLKVSKDSQFRQLTAGDFSDSIMDAVASQSGAHQKAMELQMFTHLKNIRLLCKPAQIHAFDSLFVKVLNRRGGEEKKQQPK